MVEKKSTHFCNQVANIVDVKKVSEIRHVWIAPNAHGFTDVLLHRAERIERWHVFRATLLHHPQDHLELVGGQAKARKIVKYIKVTHLREHS